jgi:hypothetical protein
MTVNKNLRHPHPAQAAGELHPEPDTGGNSGETAGDPLVGVGAASADGSQPCETPHPCMSHQHVRGTNSKPSSSSLRESQSTGYREASGNGSEYPGREDAPSPTLKPRTFCVGTWNMQGSNGRDKTRRTYKKLPLAEDIMFVKKLSLLILTETHSEQLNTSHKTAILAQTGSGQTAGIAILAPNNSSWSTNKTYILIPGHAILTKLSHSISRETFWLLAIYGNISNSTKLTSTQTLRKFYSNLSQELTLSILDIQTTEPWPSCIAAGDWNLTEHSEDRDPPKPTDTCTKKHFANIKTLCLMTNAAGPGPMPSLWTYRKKNAHGITSSRLDRIYRPLIGWTSSNPTSIPTNWSDHNIMHCTMVVKSPTVQTAKPAPRMPDIKNLTKPFWRASLDSYRTLISQPIGLKPWVDMKTNLLKLGMKTAQTMKKKKTADWNSLLRGELLSKEDILTYLSKPRFQGPHPSCSPTSCQWAPALPDASFSHGFPPYCGRRATRWPHAADPPPDPHCSSNRTNQ